MRKAITTHLRDFLAVVGLAAIAVVTTVVILIEQGVAFPGWVPGIGSDRFELRAEFVPAQAVTPGQGQTVNVAGIRVGDVTAVELEDGRAVVTMQVDEEYAPLIHRDASLLLRPRTGLQDMTIEVDPGAAEGEPVAEGATIPVAQTRPNVNPDQILAALDADTRDYLKLLLAGGAEGLGGRGEQLSAGLRRFEPTARDLARLNGALAKRRQSLRRVIHNFGLLAEEIGRGDTELAGFVDSSNAVMDSFASQEASIREALRELPGTLEQTREALDASGRLSGELAPALREMVPAAKALAPALREVRPFFRRTRKPIRDQIRPFTKAVSAPVRHLRQAADPLGETTEGLKGGLGELNGIFNTLAHNPSGDREGYLFYLSWFNHNTNSAFTLQDAHGPLRRGMVLLDCTTAGLADGVASGSPYLKTLIELTRLPTTAEICPPFPEPFPKP